MGKPITSGEALLSDVLTYGNAGAGIIHVRAKEVARAYKELRDGLTVAGIECRTWNVVTGSYTMTTDDVQHLALHKGDTNPDIQGNLISLFNTIDEVDEDSYIYHLYVNPERWFEDASIEYLIQQFSRDLPSTYHRIVFITSDATLPDNISDLMVSATMDTPTYTEMHDVYTSLTESLPKEYIDRLAIDDTGVERICNAGSGLTYEEFETYLSEAFVRSTKDMPNQPITHEDILGYLNKSKTYIVNKSDLLELYPAESIDNVGGLENIKDWVSSRAGCYSDEAKEAGIEAPKGILLTGISGTGKSLIAKSVAGILGTGLVRLDFGRMFNSFVGKSEERIRDALKLAESLAPIVIFCVDGETRITQYDGSTLSAEDLYHSVTNLGAVHTLKGYDPHTGGIVPMSISRMLRHKGKPMLRLTDEQGTSIDVTEGHRLLVDRDGDRSWVEAINLVEGDVLVTPT